MADPAENLVYLRANPFGMNKLPFLLALVFIAPMHAQETLCDQTYTVGTQEEFEVAAPTTGGSLPMMAPLFMTTFAGEIMVGQDSCFGMPCSHHVYNTILVDTVTTCIDYTLTDAATGVIDTLNCCFDQAWDSESQFWLRVGNTSDIMELVNEFQTDHRMYDLMGRELREAPVGQLYIQHRKLHFREE